MKYTIGITTFVHRFDKYFKPLIEQIKRYNPEVEIIVYINGQYGRDFDNEYRSNILRFISEYDNIYPMMSPHFKSLSKMWNNIIIQSSNNNILIFNDDISIEDIGFFSEIEDYINLNNTSFMINRSFSHFHVNRDEVFDVGFFEERLIGLGEEDGDWCFRWEKKYQKSFPILRTEFIKSYFYIIDENNSEGMEKDKYGKYTSWNANWLFSNKYDPSNLELAMTQGFPANSNSGLYKKPVSIREDFKHMDFYPAEKFIWSHIGELKELKK